MGTLKIEYLSIGSLQPYKNNAREHRQKSIDTIKASIQEFGFNDPIGIWSKDNIIVEGHGRWMAAQELGLTEVPVIRLDDLSDEQRRAYALAHNKTTEMSDWNSELLSTELNDLLDSIDLESFGFDLEKDVKDDSKAFDDNYDIDTAYDLLPIKVQKGEVWQLGKHRLMCGDSTNSIDVATLMNGVTADLLYTDPPYNVNVSNADGLQIDHDNMNSTDFRAFLNAAFNCASSHLKPGGAFYVWHSESESINFRECCEENGLMVKQCLIWVKNSFTFGRQDYKWKHEPCLYGWKYGASHYFVYEFNNPTVIDDFDIDSMKKEEMKALITNLLEQFPSTVFHENKPIKNDLHPTMKPIPLCSRMIRNSAKVGEVVLDLFGGSGSTLVCCEQLNRICYMMEYDEKYATVVIDRFEKLTGQKAVKIC